MDTSNDLSLQGKVALVTGGTRGIGLAIARALLTAGASVFATYRVDESSAVLAKALGIHVLRCDISDVNAVQQMFAELKTLLPSESSGNVLDILVNNAGVHAWGSVETTKVEDLDRVFAVNVRGTFLVTQCALPLLAEGGRIINISSGISRRPAPLFAAYAMTKAAINQLTLTLSAELGNRNIAVNTLAPGWTATDINAEARKDEALVHQIASKTAMGRLGAPEDISRVALLLASEQAQWITGQYIQVVFRSLPEVMSSRRLGWTEEQTVVTAAQ